MAVRRHLHFERIFVKITFLTHCLVFALYLVHPEAATVLAAFRAEALQKWDFEAITQEVLVSQRRRRFVWGALKTGIYFNMNLLFAFFKMSL